MVVKVQPTVILFILTPCLSGLISSKLNNSEVNDLPFCWGTSWAACRTSAFVIPALEATEGS